MTNGAAAGSTSRFLKSIKSTWMQLAQFAVWICGVIGLFLVNPPELWEGAGPDPSLRFAQFLAAILSGLVLIAAVKWHRRKHLKLWIGVTVASTAIGAPLFFFYQFAHASWTCSYVQGKAPKVVGIHLSAPAEKYMQETPGRSCDELVQAFTGKTQQIWPASEIMLRYIVLVLVFTAITLFFATAMIGLVQSIRTANNAR